MKKRKMGEIGACPLPPRHAPCPLTPTFPFVVCFPPRMNAAHFPPLVPTATAHFLPQSDPTLPLHLPPPTIQYSGTVLLLHQFSVFLVLANTRTLTKINQLNHQLLLKKTGLHFAASEYWSSSKPFSARPTAETALQVPEPSAITGTHTCSMLSFYHH